MAANNRHWSDSFPVLDKVTDPAWREVARAAQLIEVQAGTPLFRENEACEHYLLILGGSVRVQRLAANGQVITLYHLGAGQACELTTSCLLGGRCYPAEGIAETRVHAVLIPKNRFREALAQSPQFSEFVFSSIDRGMNELITLVEQVAFGHMDQRLAQCLLQIAHHRDRIEVTHNDLAEELGTAREVVSRLLKEFERHGWVRLHRGWMEICDRETLQALAAKPVL